ncbi:MAG TPA: hypothetical protein PKN96_04500, partial [Flavobacterium sp.]|uniref:hypothetical protein n=1 Tax=Flavobacterium sp. TaxID=239 RepID=UPI002C427B11
FILALFAFSVFSCQDETESIVQDTSNNFTKTSPIASLISRVSQYETTIDNVLDGTSNCAIKLPAHVTVDGQYVYVVSQSDYEAVQDIKDQSSTDDDKVHFNYPITIIYPNYYEHVLNSEAEFNTMMAGYGDDSAYHEVSCLNFNYPITINIYNTNNQVASTVTIQTDSQLYNFIHELNNSQIVGIVFPITITNPNSQQITIHNNVELETAINSAVGSCSNSSTSTPFSDVLTSGSWYVSYFFEENHEETYHYNGYNFTFNSNGTSLAVKTTTTISGDWDIHNTTPERLDLHFTGSQLEELEKNWTVQEYTTTYIRLKTGNGGPEDCSYLSLTKN